MSWWWAIGLGYLVVSWIGCLLFLKVCGSAKRQFWDDVAQACGHDRNRQALVLTALILIFGPVFPFVLAHCMWTCWREERATKRFWKKFRRTHRPVEFERLHLANLPKAAQEHIERHSPVLERQGFVPAVTCRLKPEPFPIHALCLLSRGGDTIGNIELIDEAKSVSFESILTNGHAVETAYCPHLLSDDDLAKINRSGRYTAQMVQWDGDQELLAGAYERHLTLLAELEQRYDCGTLHLAANQIPEAKRYTNAVYGNVRFELGEIDNRPQMLPCPVAPVGRISSPAPVGAA